MTSFSLPPDVLERFYSKIDVPIGGDGLPDRAACWLWTAGRTAGGNKAAWPYGTFRIGSVVGRAHRIALAIYTGVMPPDMDAAHSDACSSGLCCNPHHLEWKTTIQNRYDDVIRRYRARLDQAAAS